MVESFIYSSSSTNTVDGVSKRELQAGFRKVANQLVDIFLKRALLIETGAGEIQARQKQREIKQQIEEIFSAATFDISPESDEGQRIRFFAKPILECFINSNLMRSIYSDSYLNIVHTCILLARKPELFERLVIQTGFGGTADEDINVRLPAYIVPGLQVMENLRALKNTQKFDFNLPRLRLFSAPHSAVAVNSAQMSREVVLRNTELSTQYLQQYIHRFHPEVSNRVFFEVEKPWEEHNSMTQTIIAFFAAALEHTDDPLVIKTLEVLRERGNRHGNKTGSELAHVYAAMHSLLFKDSLRHPETNVFDDQHKDLLNVSLGGRPERLFNTDRAYIRGKFDGQVIQDLRQNGVQYDRVSFDEWMALLNDQPSEKYDDLTFLHLPYLVTLVHTTVGATPVYYRTVFDQGLGEIDGTLTSFINAKKSEIQSDLNGQEKSLALSRLAEVEHDLHTVIQDAGGEDKFMNFLNSVKLG